MIGTVCIGNDFLSDPKLTPWRQRALQRGFRSSIALPLKADDLAYGITALRVQADRDQAQKSLLQKTTQLRTPSAELVRAEHNERRRLAQVLHDQQQQLLVGARYKLESLRSESKPKVFQQTVRHLDALLAQCLDCSRSLTAELNPRVLNEAGLATALKWLARWFRDTHGLTVKVIADAPVNEVKAEVQTALFQAVRELLFHVVKHARVKQARVRISRRENQQARVVVSDRGVGFDPADLPLGQDSVGGLGLFSLRERLDLLGGQLEIESAPGCGSRFTLLAPLQGKPV